MNLAALTAQLENTLATGGWDAICAVSAANMNSLLLNWYLSNGPTNPDLPVQFVFPSESNYCIFDAVLGPPEISFTPEAAAGKQCQITMIVTSGVLLEFSPTTSTVVSGLILQPDAASVTGTVTLCLVTGKAALGELTLDLQAGAYTPAIAGVPPTSVQATQIDTGLQNFFHVNAVSFPLGGVTTSKSISPWLQPTSFDFAVQTNPACGGDGCVLMLIQTSGPGGSSSFQVPAYPVPDGYAASLLVSNNVMFNGPLLAQFNAAMAGVTFGSAETSPGSGIYQINLLVGAVDLGVISYPDASGAPYTSNKGGGWFGAPYDTADMVLPLSSLSFNVSGGALSAGYSHTWDQGWAFTPQILSPGPGTGYEGSTMALTYNPVGAVTIAQPSNCVVTFDWTGAPNCTSTLDSDLQKAFTGCDPGSQVEQTMSADLSEIFSSLTAIPGIDTFALQNLLFYPNQTLSMTTGATPCDLLLVGSTVPEIVISPSSVQIGRGASAIDFTATLSGAPVTGGIWEMKPSAASFGSIDSSTGVYTPPSTLPERRAVTISVTNGAQSGNALVVLNQPQPANGLTVSPPNLVITSGQTFDFTVTDSNGDEVNVTWTLNPPSPEGGAIVSVFGSWQYTAPATIGTASTVTLTATSIANPGQYGTATVDLLAPALLTVTASSQSVAPSGTVDLTAAPPGGLGDLTWVIYPTGAGTLQVSSDTITAVYTAPAAAPPANTVQIVAYGVEAAPPIAAVGFVSINVAS